MCVSSYKSLPLSLSPSLPLSLSPSLSLYSELCGDLSTYADMWRPDADGCEDTKSVQSLQIGPPGGAAPANFYIGGPPGVPLLGGPDPTAASATGFQMMSSPTNQVAASNRGILARSVSAQNVRDREIKRSPPLPPVKPHPKPHPPGHISGVPTNSPPTSPPPSPNVTPHRKSRRHSTHSLQEHLFRAQLEGHTHATPPLAPPSPALSPPPLCGLPTYPPSTATVVTTPTPLPTTLDQTGPTWTTVVTTHTPTPTPLSTTIGRTAPIQTTAGPKPPHPPPPHTSTSTHTQSASVRSATFPRTRHARSKSSGPIDASSHPHTITAHTTTPTRRQTHSRNLSTSCVPGKDSRHNLLSNTPELSRSSVSINTKFSSATKPLPPPNPGMGYDYAKHFNLFSPFTSNMALEYCRREDEGSKVAETPPPPVWCMDVWNKCIAVGCGNGQIEVGVACLVM